VAGKRGATRLGFALLFARKAGATWLNMLNDQSAGLAAKVFSGTPRDSLNMVDVVMSQSGGRVPDVIITDAGSYSDIVFGLLHMLGFQYPPNLPDQRLWRFDCRHRQDRRALGRHVPGRGVDQHRRGLRPRRDPDDLA
jgi:TnpA family transposase